MRQIVTTIATTLIKNYDPNSASIFSTTKYLNKIKWITGFDMNQTKK